MANSTAATPDSSLQRAQWLRRFLALLCGFRDMIWSFFFNENTSVQGTILPQDWFTTGLSATLIFLVATYCVVFTQDRFLEEEIFICYNK
jgi:hypothetical protein